jgi:hypothetical protein
MVLATPAGISAEKAKRGAKHSQKIVVMKRMEREMSKSARFGDTKIGQTHLKLPSLLCGG